MKWMLVAIYLSGWDQSMKEQHIMAYFSEKKSCQIALNEAGQIPYTRFMCLEEAQDITEGKCK